MLLSTFIIQYYSKVVLIINMGSWAQNHIMGREALAESVVV